MCYFGKEATMPCSSATKLSDSSKLFNVIPDFDQFKTSLPEVLKRILTGFIGKG